LFVEKPDFVWGLIASMYTGNIIGVLMVLAFVPFFAAILKIPFAILTPLIVVICAVGSYAVHNSMIDIWYMVIFGVVGYVFKKLDYPLAPLVLALAVRPLPGHKRVLGQIWGAAGAVVLRLLSLGIVMYLLEVPFLKLVGGLLLVWIAFKLVQSESGADSEVKHGASLWEAIW